VKKEIQFLGNITNLKMMKYCDSLVKPILRAKQTDFMFISSNWLSPPLKKRRKKEERECRRKFPPHQTYQR